MTSKINSIHHLLLCQSRRGKRRRSPKRRSIKSICFIAILAGFISFCCLSLYAHYNSDNLPDNEEIIVDLSNNYLSTTTFGNNTTFLVNTNKCQIPEENIWDSGIKSLVKPPSKFQCAETYMRLTYVDKSTVVVNANALKSVGYKIDEITCCYNTIHRVDQSKESCDKDADNSYRYSENCFPMDRVTKPISAFIKVTCKAKGLFPGFFQYTNFHMIAKIPESAQRKRLWWENCLGNNGSLKDTPDCKRFREYGRPPSVLMLGLDSTSRGNFYRFMPKTKEILNSVIKPVEMVGYHKVGENTFPNFVPLMSSLSVKDLVKTCFSNSSVPQDDCPYVWKQFSAQNYLTAHLEDSPSIAIFNYFKTGFIRPPTDIYIRPFMLAAYEEKGGGEAIIDCIGYQRPEEMILNYILDLAELSEAHKIPYFITTWLTDLTHHDMNNLQLVDSMLAKTLQNLYTKGLLENTVLYLMSDHGYRFTQIRMTQAGWYEDKLPTMWVKVPPSVVKAHWHWIDALQYNSRMLTTPYDIHASFKHILYSYWPSLKSNGMESPRGVSIFLKVPTRSCDDAGIPQEFCGCIAPTHCRFNQTMIKQAAEMVVNSINLNLPRECSHLGVSKVTACGTIRESENGLETGDGESKNYGLEVLVIALYTRPGNFLFEALVHLNTSLERSHGNGSYFSRVSKLMRMNEKTTSSACLVKKDSWMELLCFCDTFSIFNTISRNLLK